MERGLRERRLIREGLIRERGWLIRVGALIREGGLLKRGRLIREEGFIREGVLLQGRALDRITTVNRVFSLSSA